MCHPSPGIAMLARRGESVHIDPTLLDVAGAMAVLPVATCPPKGKSSCSARIGLQIRS